MNGTGSSSPPRRAPARVRLFCMPHAGGAGTFFRLWKRELAEDVELCPLDRSDTSLWGNGRQMREAVDALAAALRPTLDVPYVLFGHSMGGLIAFELARQLGSLGGPAPRALIISGCRAPSLLPARTNVHTLPDPELLQLLVQLGGTPREILDDDELRPLILESVRRDYALLASYRYTEGEALRCPLVLMRGSEDPETTDERIQPWQGEVAHPVVVHTFDGGHFFLANDRGAVARRVNAFVSIH